MPQSRKTRQTGASKASQSVVLDEATKKKCHSIIQDFDRQVLARIDASRSKIESIYSQIRTKTNLLILQTPKEIQDMKLSEFEALLLSGDSGLPSSESSTLLLPPPPPETGTLRKSRRTKKNTSTTNKENSSSSSIRSTTTRSMTTPAHPRGSKRAVPTPMTIKTKFNIGTPLTKSICRLAKPDEPLVSMSGSPVMLGGTGGAIKEVIKELSDIPKDQLLTIQSKINEALEQKK